MDKFMANFILDSVNNDLKEIASLCVVKISTSYWKDKNGLHIKKDISFLRRKCVGFNILEEEISNVGAKEAVFNIVNLEECDDGIYYVIMCNESRDFESGHIDDYEIKLVPYREE